MTDNPIPDVALEQHTAILGKTGSGKTSTAKLVIEHVVAAGARVCVLDPIKSDWWGLISSADGKRPGLPFNVLGGPHGHVPVHASAGKAIGELVATGELPLSIIDMANFEPGGQAKFFVDFAPVLLRRMRGVLYLVIEEAHLFAPKERSGIGAENMAIHWAKTLATAGRSKGLRIIMATQRTQALHNALLGSCDTLIAHRMTAPADQEPVIKWLKANVTKEVRERVESSLSSLPTGTAWICSGEARLFERVAFPRISTFDNTATPTDDSDTPDIQSAVVDQDRLRSVIGAAVAEAEANDPAKLKKRIAELEKAETTKAPQNIPELVEAAEKRGYAAGQTEGHKVGYAAGRSDAARDLMLKFQEFVMENADANSGTIARPMSLSAFAMNRNPAGDSESGGPAIEFVAVDDRHIGNTGPDGSRVVVIDTIRVPEAVSPSTKKLVDAIVSAYPVGLTLQTAAKRAGLSPRSSAFRKYLQEAAASPRIQQREDGRYVAVAPEDGLAAPRGLAAFKEKLPPSYASILSAIEDVAPDALTPWEAADRAGVSRTSSGLTAALRELVALELVIRDADGFYRLSPDFEDTP